MKKLRTTRDRLLSCVVAVLLLLGLTYQQAFAQSVDWERSHGSSVSGYSVVKIDDGGFIAVGAGGQWPNT
ncbi:MAG TPA: hypothetical protein VFH43_04795, partial [Candidatus Kapabacteria bacterium]|nr:hypothetical protein [Candidatus Kapabacteria bacterium]